MQSFLYTLLIFFVNASSGSAQQQDTLNWADTPGSRGTLTILFSCAAALGLCVWTGVHLNVDPSGGNQREKMESVSRFLGKVVWASIALLAPDIVLSVALHQFLVAYEYQRAVNEFAGNHQIPWYKIVAGKIRGWFPRDREGGDNEQQKSEPKQMKLQMAFFATMGGFCFEENTPNGPRWNSLRVGILRRFRTMDRIHDYPLPEISDKSKASGLAKTVAVFQTGWILLQCLDRLLGGLHITILELNTAVHVVIAIVMYGVWWEKPFDIGRPIAIDPHGLGDNSVTTIYVEKIRGLLESAENAIKICVPKSQADKGKGAEISNHESEVRLHSKEGELSGGAISGEGVSDKILDTVVLFKTIGEAPEEASRMFRTVANAINRHFLDVIYADIKEGALSHYRHEQAAKAGSTSIRRDVVQAAYQDAFDVANETAFRVAHENIFSAAHAYRISVGAEHKDNEPEGMGVITEEKVSKIMRATAKQVGGDSKKKANPLREALEKVSAATNKASFKAAFKAALRAAVAAESTPADGGDQSDPTSQAAQPTLKDTSKMSLIATVRAASAAARAASRHAVRLVALEAVLGHVGAADAAQAALHKVAKDIYEKEYKKEGRQLTECIVNKVCGGAGNAFREHFEMVALDVSSDIPLAADILERSTATGIYTAAREAISRIRDETVDDQRRDFTKADEILSKLTPVYSRTGWQRLKSSLETAGNVVEDQIIKVPGLFRPSKGEKNREKEMGRRQTGGNSNDEEPTQNNGGTQSEEQSEKKLPPVPREVFDSAWRRRHRGVLLGFSGVTGAFYGAIHLTKWNSPWFPTETEHLLWQIACSVGSAAVIPIALLAAIPFFAPKPGPKRTSYWRLLCIAVCGMFWTVFISARLFIIVESFVSLRSLPRDAYIMAQWTNAIPHI